MLLGRRRKLSFSFSTFYSFFFLISAHLVFPFFHQKPFKHRIILFEIFAQRIRRILCKSTRVVLRACYVNAAADVFLFYPLTCNVTCSPEFFALISHILVLRFGCRIVKFYLSYTSLKVWKNEAIEQFRHNGVT